MENIGASTVASASREQLVYIIDVSKAAVPEALEILTDAVLNPKFAAWDVREAAAKLEEDIKSLADNPQSLLLEVGNPVACAVAKCCCCRLLLQSGGACSAARCAPGI